jgi:CheY-like chemotaxis protein
VRDGTQGLLKSWGCLVLTAESEEAAMAKLAERDRRPDLIISDYHLAHGKAGFELIDRLRRACDAQIPAFLISGDTAPALLREASASGYYLLHKPVLPITLRSVVSQLLKDQPGEVTARAYDRPRARWAKSAASSELVNETSEDTPARPRGRGDPAF